MGFSRQECWSGVPLPSPIIYICLNHFAVHLKLTQPCKSAVLQTKIIFLKNTNLGGFWASLVAQMVKNPPVMREIWVRSLGWEEPLEKEMASRSSILAWRIPMDGGAWWAAVHGVAKSRTRLSDFTFMHWRRKWQPTPVFLPGESQGRGSLVGCCLWGRTESDTIEAT